MKLSDFRADKELVSAANRVLSDPVFKVMLDVLREEHPKNYRKAGEEVSFFASHKLGRIAGYDEFESNLLKMTEISKPQETLTATFAPVSQNA